MDNIFYFSEEIDFSLPNTSKISEWINSIASREGFEIISLNYIFCTDQYLHNINLTYLDHDTFTDIITFDNSDFDEIIEGDIFISIERIEENATIHHASFDSELHRVIIHGLLHLCGYPDKSEKEAKLMRSKEDEALSILDI